MADDAAYTSFLQKANAPLTSNTQTAATSSQTKSKLHDHTTTKVSHPASLNSLTSITYTSDTDSPFEPIALSYGSGGDDALPTVSEFAACVGVTDAAVEVVAEEEFQQYAEVLRTVAKAGKKEDAVRIFRVGMGATRAVYYVVTLGEGKLVGVRAEAVES